MFRTLLQQIEKECDANQTEALEMCLRTKGNIEIDIPSRFCCMDIRQCEASSTI